MCRGVRLGNVRPYFYGGHYGFTKLGGWYRESNYYVSFVAYGFRVGANCRGDRCRNNGCQLVYESCEPVAVCARG